jgi:hypothetical protein
MDMTITLKFRIINSPDGGNINRTLVTVVRNGVSKPLPNAISMEAGRVACQKMADDLGVTLVWTDSKNGFHNLQSESQIITVEVK